MIIPLSFNFHSLYLPNPTQHAGSHLGSNHLSRPSWGEGGGWRGQRGMNFKKLNLGGGEAGLIWITGMQKKRRGWNIVRYKTYM